MPLFRLDASIMPASSSSAELADIVERHWVEEHPGSDVVRRHLGQDPLPSTAWTDAVTAGFVPEEDRTEDQRRALDLAGELVRELSEAEAIVLAVPLYNFGVSQHVKAWIDLVIVGAGAGNPFLEGKPVVLTTVRGGAYGEGTPREGWDHSTAYLRRILGDVWGADLTVVEREFTLVGVNPALDEFTELAGQLHEQALVEATSAGRDLATQVPVAQAS